MKKIFLTTAMFVLFANFSIAQTRTLDLGEFTGIRVGQTFQVHLIQADRNEIIVPEGISDDVFQVIGNTLRIQGASANQREPIIVLFKSLDSLIASGTARITSEGQITGDRLILRLTGASQAKLNLAYERVSSSVCGTALLDLAGIVTNIQRITGSGASSINVEQLQAERTDIHLRGASRARVYTVTATGSALGTTVLHLNPEAENLLAIQTTARVFPPRQQTSTSAQGSERQRHPEGWLHGVIEDGLDIEGVRLIGGSGVSPRRPRGFSPRYAVLDFGFVGFGQNFFQHTLPSSHENMMLSRSQSFTIGVNLPVFDVGIRLGQSNFGVGSVVGLNWNIFRFLESDWIASIDRDTDTRQFLMIQDTSLNYIKSNLRSSWIRLPVFVQYQQGHFSALVGIVGNVRMGSSAKQVWLNDRSSRRRNVDRGRDMNRFYLNGFRADAEMRITYRQVGVFATYSLTNMFVNNRGPELNTFSFGFSLGL